VTNVYSNIPDDLPNELLETLEARVCVLVISLASGSPLRRGASERLLGVSRVTGYGFRYRAAAGGHHREDSPPLRAMARVDAARPADGSRLGL
jgi:hypothetical protein